MSEQKLIDWEPSSALSNVASRALLLKKARAFFSGHGVMEVDTPLLCHTSTPCPAIDSFNVRSSLGEHYLQTSPEFAMKRLLAAGSGPIYQFCKAFRQEESGRFHNPEFTILEWYRPGFNHHNLMDEMDALLQALLETAPSDRISYHDLFQTHCNIDPHTASADELSRVAQEKGIDYAYDADKDTWLNLLLSHAIEPTLGKDKPVFIYDYPTSQAALSRINNNVAERFEVYYKGVELANGFHELTDANEQRLRFKNENKEREQLGKPTLPIDNKLISALEAGIPDCAGVALGFDRLVMLATNANHIKEVMAFTIENA